jgi:transketolase
MVGLVMEALDALDRAGICAEVVNLHTVKPLDVEGVVALARRTGAVVTVEDHTIMGGLGSAVAEALGEYCPVPLRRVGIPDRFAESAATRDLMNRYGLSQNDIVAAILDVMARRRA